MFDIISDMMEFEMLTEEFQDFTIKLLTEQK